jgi:hypothetical protein
MLHGAGIFTYITGRFWTRANVGIHIPYMEHMGIKHGNVGGL